MKVVLITGASSGIGALVAKKLAERKSYALVLVARRQERLESLAEACQALGAQTHWVLADLNDPEAPKTIIEETVRLFGRIDILVNNAGFGLPALFAESDPAAIRSQLQVNLVAPILLGRLAIPYLIATKGVMVNVGSAITYVANTGLGAYGATKAGLGYWSSALRREMRRHRVSICLVEPGPIKTEFFDALSLRKAPGDPHHPMIDAPWPWMSVSADLAARRIVRLIERPKGRLAFPRRFIWPWRMIGGFFQLFPRVGDVAVSNVVRYYDWKLERSRANASHSD